MIENRDKMKAVPEFEVVNAYDACMYPSIDYLGVNDPCDLNAPLERMQELTRAMSDVAAISNDLVAYCGQDIACYEVGTGWTFIWSYNAAWAIIMGANFILLTFGAYWFWPRYIGSILNCCFGIFHISGVSMMFAGVMNPAPQLCALNKSTVAYKGDYEWDYDGITYSNEYSILTIFAIV